jgi:subtilisin family serine protease
VDGTSVAGPHVAGLVALIISANPALAGKVSVIEEIIQKTAKPLTLSQTCGSTSGTSVPNNAFGYGRIDALAAVNMATSILSVNDADKSTAVVQPFPNPFSTDVNFEFKNWKKATTLEVYSLKGTMIFSKTWENVPATYTLNLFNHSSGVYFYKVMNGSECINGRLFKVDE